MINNSLAALDRISAPGAAEPGPEPRTVSCNGAGSREPRLPLALWIYVARGVGRIILSVLALPFV